MRNRAVHAFGVSCVRAAQGEPACRPRRNPSTTPSETSQLTALGLANRSMQKGIRVVGHPPKEVFSHGLLDPQRKALLGDSNAALVR
jgi:hypothetical protein